MRLPERRPEALLVGVYPSAFHVAYAPPGHSGRPLIGSLAVDVEPVVFWDGAAPTPAAEFERWLLDVGFDPEHHGAVRPGHNARRVPGWSLRFSSRSDSTPAELRSRTRCHGSS